MITKDNLAAAADDILFDIGKTPSAIQKYVTAHVKYSYRYKTDRESMVAYAMNYHTGACFYYAAFCDYLLERAGYEHLIIDGSSSNTSYSEHNWNLYKTSNGWRHLDACPISRFNPSTFSGWTDVQIRARRTPYWDTSKYPAAV